MTLNRKGFFGEVEHLCVVTEAMDFRQLRKAQLFPDDGEGAAVVSECGKYRYMLTRQIQPTGETLLASLLNPSTADHKIDDTTVGKLCGFATRLGFARLLLVNLFAYRATSPNKLYIVTDPVGPFNDDAIVRAIQIAGKNVDNILVGWGTNGNFMGRGGKVVKLIKSKNRQLYALGINRDDTPKHPLYVPYETELIPYNPIKIN